jgi:hemerythrin superfamily protein
MSQANTAGQMPDSNDVVVLLKQQHDEIRALLDEVLATTGEDREHAFNRLVHLLVVHETAEGEIVHPYVHSSVEGGELVVADRLKEESEATRVLSELEGADTNTAEFLKEFAALREDVLAHARAEEDYEFPYLHQEADPARLQAMAKALRAAQAVAPTRPHPGIDSPAKTVAFGPAAAVIDRTRDAIRRVLG